MTGRTNRDRRQPQRPESSQNLTTAREDRSRALAPASWSLAVIAVVLIGVLTYFMTLTTRPEISEITPDPNTSQPPGEILISASISSQRSIEDAALFIDEEEFSPELSEVSDSLWRVEHEQVLERGQRQITLQVTDSSGRTTEHSWSVEAGGDVIEPRMVLLSPPGNVLLAPGDNGVVIQATTFADIDEVEIAFDGEPVNAEIEELGTGTEYSNQDDLPIYDWHIRAETRLSGGGTEVTAHITDEFGATSSQSWIMRVVWDEDEADAQFFRDTGEYLAEPFLSYWEEHNGETTIGPPVSSPIADENGEQLQFFRYARLELDEDGDVHRGLIGREMFGEPENPPDRAPGSGARHFEVTGHYIVGTIRDFWEENGGLEVFGYPVSQEYETDNGYAQYFERALIEVSEFGSHEFVELAPLGERLYDSHLHETERARVNEE